MKAALGVMLALVCCGCGDGAKIIREFSPPRASGTISIGAAVDVNQYQTLELRLVGEGLTINESADLAMTTLPYDYALSKSFWGCQCDTCWQVHAWLSKSPSAGALPLTDEPQANAVLDDACTNDGNGNDFSGIDLTLK